MSKHDFTVGFETKDPELGIHLAKMSDGLSKMQGDTIGPFDHPDGVAADAPFDLEHSLGEVPARFIVEDPGTTGGVIYATDEDRDSWTGTAVRIRSKDSDNKRIVIRVVGQGGVS